MKTAVGRTSLEDTVQGSGVLRRGEQSIHVAAFIFRHHPYAFDSQWEGTLYIGGDHRLASEVAFGRNGSGPLRLEGRADRGRNIVVTELRATLVTSGRIEVQAYEVRYHTGRLDRVPDEQHVVVSLTPTPIAVPEVFMPVLHWTGEIKEVGKRRREPKFIWRTDLGRAQLAQHFHFEETEVDGVKGLVRIPVPTISFRLRKRRYSSSQDSLLDAVSAVLEDPLTVISLLSRRHVRWFKISVSARWSEEGNGDWDEAEWHQRPGVSNDRRGLDALVNPHRMGPSGLAGLIERFGSSPYKDGLKSAVLYSNVALNTPFIETMLLNGFTALEAAVSTVMSQDNRHATMESAQFKRLQRRVKSEVRAFGEEVGLPTSAVEAACKKVPELRRRPIVDQVVDVITFFQVQWDDLWPPGENLHTHLSAAFSRRNAFVHGGRLGSVTQAHVDALRIQALAERTIYAILGGDVDWWDHGSYRHLSGLDRSDAVDE